MALNQHKNGADVIFQVAGGSGEGVIAAAKEARFYAIGVDSPQEHLAPDVVLTSMLKRLDIATFDMIKAKARGRFQRDTTVSLRPEERRRRPLLVRRRRLIPADVAARLKTITKDIADGKIVVKGTNNR